MYQKKIWNQSRNQRTRARICTRRRIWNQSRNQPKPEFVPEEGFETKVETKEPEPEFTIPNTEDSTTVESSTHQLSLILHHPEEEFIPPPAIHRRKWAKSTINMSAFSNVTPEVVDRMPWIPDGDHIYIIRCEEDYWHDKQIDGHLWRMTKSFHTGLVGIKKFGACRGSFICLNDDCPIYTAEHIRNRVDFMKENYGTYSCSNCKVFVQCRQCNAWKVTEFDQKDNVLTIYHQGKHTCTPKPDVEEQRQVAAEKRKELPPLNLELRNTPWEFQIDLIGYYIATGQLEKGKELAKLLSHKILLEQIKYGDLDGIVRDITGGRGQSEVDTFKNVGKLNQVQMNLIGVTYSK